MKQIKVQPYDKYHYIVTEDYPATFGGISFIVPKGFITDGNSTIWSRFSPRYITASILHDWLYYSGETTRLEADQIYLHAMQELGTNKVLRGIFYIGVRLFGWIPFNDYRKNDI